MVIGWWTETETETETERQRQKQRHTDKQTDRQTDKQTSPNRHWLTQGDLPNLCKCALKLGILWVRGPFAPTRLTKSANKPTILWVCGLRTRLRVAFGMALVRSDRAPSSETCGFEDQLAQICFCVDMAPNPQFTEIGARFDYCSRKPTRYPQRMCKKTRTTWCNIENLEKWFE